MTTVNKIVERVPGPSLGFRDATAWDISYTSAADMVRDCRDAVDTRKDLVVFDLEDSHWIGRKFRDWTEVVQSVDGTWKEGVDRVEELAQELAREELPRPTVVRRKRVWSDSAGDEVCIDRYRTGDPFMRDQTRLAISGPRVITLLTQIGQNCSYSSESLFWRGALSVALARIVEDAGYRTEITVFGQSHNTYISNEIPHCAISCQVKGAGDALDIGMIANVTSGWFFRTVYFGAMLAPRVATTYGLGRMQEATPQMIERLAPNAKPWVVSGAYDKKSSLALARQLLATLVV